MNIKYRKLVDDTRSEGFSFYPLLQVFLRNGLNMRPVLALVDSGSVDCVFPASIGEVLGVDIPSGQPYEFHGFDLRLVPGFVHKLHLQVAGFTHWVEVDAVFLESEGMAILGQRGFFESYQIVFERWARQFEVKTKTDAMIRNRRGYGRRR
ncbi:MAG TPA: hypothetical protein VFH91_07275 [Pyrinomonadaceae bacterium]|nr:hypothetical protein [Pyrinomonadaceae bacterium]